LLDCLDWVPNRSTCIDACFVWWRDTLFLAWWYGFVFFHTNFSYF